MCGQSFREMHARRGEFRSQFQRRFKTMRGVSPTFVLQKENAEVVLRVGIAGIELRDGRKMFQRLVLMTEANQGEAEIVLAAGETRFDAHGVLVKHEGAGVVAIFFKIFAERIFGDVIIPGYFECVQKQAFTVAPIGDLQRRCQYAANERAAADKREKRFSIWTRRAKFRCAPNQRDE